MATGLQNGFSGKELLIAAEMGAAQGLTMGELGINPSSTGSPFESASLSFGKQVALAGLSNLQGQALMLATNQEKRFNWTDLELATANGAIQFVGAQVGSDLASGSRFGTNLFGNIIDTFAGNALASACPGVRFNLADTISQTLGSTVGQQIGGALMDAQMARLARQQQAQSSQDNLDPWQNSSWKKQAEQTYDQQQVLLYDASNGSGNSSQMTQGAGRNSNIGTSYASQSSSSDLLSTVAALQSVLTQDTGLVGQFGGAANDSSFYNVVKSAAQADLALFSGIAKFEASAGQAFVKATADGFVDMFKASTYANLGLTFWDAMNGLSGDVFGIESPESLSRNAAREAAFSQYIQQTGAQISDDFRSGNVADLGAKFGLFASVVNPFGGEERDVAAVADLGAAADDVAKASQGSGFLAFSRRADVFNYYLKSGFTPEAALDHMRGANFDLGVSIEPIREGSLVVQYVLPRTQDEELAVLSGDVKYWGNYFAPVGTPAGNLGIYSSGRIPILFSAVRDTEVLRTTALPMVDDYSMRQYGWQIETDGGATQYFSPNKNDWEPKI